MNLYDQQSANRRRTWVIVLAFVGFLLLLGAGFDAFYVGAAGGYVPVGSIFALASVGVAGQLFPGPERPAATGAKCQSKRLPPARRRACAGFASETSWTGWQSRRGLV